MCGYVLKFINIYYLFTICGYFVHKLIVFIKLIINFSNYLLCYPHNILFYIVDKLIFIFFHFKSHFINSLSTNIFYNRFQFYIYYRAIFCG